MVSWSSLGEDLGRKPRMMKPPYVRPFGVLDISQEIPIVRQAGKWCGSQHRFKGEGLPLA